MTITNLTSGSTADPEGAGSVADPATVSAASAALQQWLQAQPTAKAELQEAVKADSRHRELLRASREADRRAEVAVSQADTLTARADPGGHRHIHFGMGVALVVALTCLDIAPLFWGAEAFGQSVTGTWIVTVILLVASVAAMWGLEVTQMRIKRKMLSATMVVAYLTLTLLRLRFLTVVGGDGFVAAALQAAVLTAVSAGLVVLGSSILARTRRPVLEHAQAAARRAQRVKNGAVAEASRADDQVERHLGSLRQIFLPWALASDPPLGVDHHTWVAALETALRRLFER